MGLIKDILSKIFTQNKKVIICGLDNAGKTTFVSFLKEGTFIEPLACVVRGFSVADFKPKKSVLVLGSGIAGLLNIKLAKVLGASKIFATDINSFRLKLAKEMGADVTINAKENVAEKIKKHNNNELTDFVILCAGVKSAVKQAIQSVKSGGTLLLFAMTPPGVEVPLDIFTIWNKQIKIVSTYAAVEKDIKEAINLLASKKLDVNDMITHKLPLSKAQKGFKLVSEAEKSIKVIIEPNK